MQMIMTEFRGKRAGLFRCKPVWKVGKVCPRCGKIGHIGNTICEVKTVKPNIQTEPQSRQNTL